MFWKKKEIEKEVVECETCGCLVNKTSAQCIKYKRSYPIIEYYYCKEHRKKYDGIYLNILGEKIFTSIMRVDENGVPVGYIMKPKEEPKKPGQGVWEFDWASTVAKPIPTVLDTEKKRIRTKECVKCNVRKSYKEFNNSRSARDHKQSYCKVCARKLASEWGKAHKKVTNNLSI